MTHVVRVYDHIGGRVLPTIYKDKEFKTKDEAIAYRDSLIAKSDAEYFLERRVMIPKFRAFNKETQKMYGIDGFKSNVRKIYRCSLAYDEFRPGHMETFHFVEDNLDNYILMQSTGMFDKNGVEIWEGDIVLTTRLIDYTYKDFKGVVKMLEGCWLIDTGTDAVYLWSEIEENEVVGNIYQNSELLERLEG